MQETPLAEKESIDDQVEWLDNGRTLYQKWITILKHR
jgi:hypothetical protein